MSRLVMKFGGTSVADLKCIANVAVKVAQEVAKNHDVIVVVSAMGDKTNELIDLIKASSPTYDKREYDAVVSSGENITAGLLALHLQSLGITTRSWQGWQIPIITNDAHSRARIKKISTTHLNSAFAKGYQVAVVSGFQGVSACGQITTLGRGGSDVSAVAIASAVNACRCDIYTDVCGIYTADPRIVRNARKIRKISYEEMLELASLGAKVLQTRSVELAMRYQIPLRVLSSFKDDISMNVGTLVCTEDKTMESKIVHGVAYCRDEAKITLVSVADRIGVAAAIFGPLSSVDVNVDMIVQNISENGRTDITFSCPRNQAKQACSTLNMNKKAAKINFHSLLVDYEVSKISIIGVGMRSHTGVAATMFRILADEGINIQIITTSEIKISVLVERKYMELAVRSLHAAFELDKIKSK